VQGDERDAIVLSIGYGKNAEGRLLYRFGPLLMAGGERRLNVAVTRARKRMTVVSSFTSADLDPKRSSAEGVRLLRSYLAYAESGGVSLGDEAVAQPPLGPFEADVRDKLVTAGIPVTARFGVAGYFIDLAAAHPTVPDEMVLAIEVDGTGYHMANTVRDRDRLRQEQLERLGWRFHRIWSVDWFADSTAEIERVREAYAEAVAAVDAKRTDEPTVKLDYELAAAAAAHAATSGHIPNTPRLTLVRPPQPARPDPRPPIPPGRAISEYPKERLVELIRWIESDTLLRTEEEMVDEVMRELGFKRRGTRITAAVKAALAEARSLQET
jgi:very-short-patch-repair endonuclease